MRKDKNKLERLSLESKDFPLTNTLAYYALNIGEESKVLNDVQLQMESESSKQEEFKDFRMIDEIILELENAYPSNSYENIIADHVRP